MYHRICQLVLTLIVIFFSASSFAACLKEGDNITVSGELRRELFYGPPNWGEDREHDEKFHEWIVQLDKPLSCVEEIDTSWENWNWRVQLIMKDKNDYKTKRDFIGKKVIINGNIFLAQNGYHTTPVLLSRAVFITTNNH